MNKFKAGDKITPKYYIDTEDITEGNTYTIKRVKGDSIEFDDDVGYPRTRHYDDYNLVVDKEDTDILKETREMEVKITSGNCTTVFNGKLTLKQYLEILNILKGK